MKKETEKARQHLQTITLLLGQLDEQGHRQTVANVATALEQIQWAMGVVLQETKEEAN